jgi:hypothetical protein
LAYNSLQLVLDPGQEIRNRLMAAVADFPELFPIRVFIEAASAVPVTSNTQFDVAQSSRQAHQTFTGYLKSTVRFSHSVRHCGSDLEYAAWNSKSL